MHITASVFINDDERGLHNEYEKWLEGLAPHAPNSQHQHNGTGEGACPERSDGNADAHLKRQVIGREVVVAVTEGCLDCGTWERVSYGEFDGRRRKRGWSRSLASKPPLREPTTMTELPRLTGP
jgi:secondary thiamine-phosphate synthase enzyme